VRNKIPRFRLYGETMQIAFRLRATGEGVVVVVVVIIFTPFLLLLLYL
jgi:hypothetical protein